MWLVVATCSFVVGAVAGGLAYFYFGENLPEDIPTEISGTEQDLEDETDEAELDIEEWLEYENEEMGYQFSYPADWYTLTENLNPPPPSTIMVASVSQDDVTSGSVYSSFFVYARDPGGQTLEDHEEILSLIDDGYTKTETMVSGQEAVRLERRIHELDTGGWVYTFCGDTLYRITWGGTSVGIFEKYEETLDMILDSFTFTGDC